MKILLPVFLILLTDSAYAMETTSNDNGFFFKPYIGADYDYTHARYQGGGTQIAEDNLNGGDIHIGVRLHKYLGAEASYFQTEQAGKSNVLGTGINTTVQLKGETFDIMGYLPVYNKLELIGTGGVSSLKATLALKGVGGHLSESQTEIKGRIGAGAQYWLTDNINIRGIVRYQGADFSGSVNNVVVSSLGLNCQF